MARSMTSLGMDSALALATARRRRAFMLGSGRPVLAATVISRESLEKALDRAESARPLRCMMFLNFECPAMVDLKPRGIRALVLPVCAVGRNPHGGRGLALLLWAPDPRWINAAAAGSHRKAARACRGRRWSE